MEGNGMVYLVFWGDGPPNSPGFCWSAVSLHETVGAAFEDVIGRIARNEGDPDGSWCVFPSHLGASIPANPEYVGGAVISRARLDALLRPARAKVEAA